MVDALNQQWVTLIEGKIYLSVGSGHVTVESMHQFDQEVISKIEASDATLVHLISDTRYILSIPSLGEMQKLKYPHHPRMGYNLTIGAFHNPLMRFIISLSLSVTRLRYRDVNTLEEACAYLAQKDPSLPPLDTWNIPANSDASAL